MSLINYFDHPERKASKEHFLHLIQVAKADSVIDKSELEMLHRVGRKLGFTDPEIDELIASKESKIYTPPYEMEKKFNQLYEVVAMALADGILYSNEEKLIRKLAINSSFNETEAEHLTNLLVNGIKLGKSKDELYLSFKQIKKN